MSDEIRLETLLDPIAKASKRTSEVLFDAWTGLVAVGTLSHSNLVKEEDLAKEYPGKYSFCQGAEKEAVRSLEECNLDEAAHHLRREAFIAKQFFNPQNEITQRCNRDADELEVFAKVRKEIKDTDTKQRIADLVTSSAEIKRANRDNQKSHHKPTMRDPKASANAVDDFGEKRWTLPIEALTSGE